MSSPARILCLDIGMRRIGVAVSGPLGVTAQPLGYIDRKKGKKATSAELANYIQTYQPSEVVVGLPLALNGREGPAVKRTRRILAELSGALAGLPLIEWDERLTSAAAERVLLEGDVSRTQRKEHVDAIAASLILQSYLGSRQHLDADDQ